MEAITQGRDESSSKKLLICMTKTIATSKGGDKVHAV